MIIRLDSTVNLAHFRFFKWNLLSVIIIVIWRDRARLWTFCDQTKLNQQDFVIRVDNHVTVNWFVLSRPSTILFPIFTSDFQLLRSIDHLSITIDGRIPWLYLSLLFWKHSNDLPRSLFWRDTRPGLGLRKCWPCHTQTHPTHLLVGLNRLTTGQSTINGRTFSQLQIHFELILNSQVVGTLKTSHSFGSFPNTLSTARALTVHVRLLLAIVIPRKYKQRTQSSKKKNK